MTWNVRREQDVVTCTFTEHLDEFDGRLSAAEFAKVVDQIDSASVIFDVRGMKGYDKPARIAWQDALRPRKAKIKSIDLIGGNAIVRMGASVMSLATGIPITVVA